MSSTFDKPHNLAMTATFFEPVAKVQNGKIEARGVGHRPDLSHTKRTIIMLKKKKKKKRVKPTNLDTLDMLQRSGKLPVNIHENINIPTRAEQNQSRQNQFQNKIAPSNRDTILRGSVSQNYISRDSGVTARSQYVRYNGSAYGGFNMTDSIYPRKSNLNERKHDVLRIAAENY